jgi:cell division protein FtsB
LNSGAAMGIVKTHRRMNIWTLSYRIGLALIAILVVIGMVAVFSPQFGRYRELRRRESALQEEIRLEQEILRHLQEQQQRLLTDPRFVEKVAREELRYVKPGETVFKFVEDEPSTSYSPVR